MRLRPNRACRVILPCKGPSMVDSINWSPNSLGDGVIDEAALKAPAQTELRPTGAGASCLVTPRFILARSGRLNAH